jgi:hypothetical protein
MILDRVYVTLSQIGCNPSCIRTPIVWWYYSVDSSHLELWKSTPLKKALRAASLPIAYLANERAGNVTDRSWQVDQDIRCKAIMTLCRMISAWPLGHSQSLTISRGN